MKQLLGSGWREECGVMGVWNFEEAARLTYLGLYAIQHRGQESAGIVSLHEGRHISYKGLGLVGDVFNEKSLDQLKGKAAIGHVRYSTQGENLIANAQPLTANLLTSPVAIAHNGNIVNASDLRRELQKQGAIFSATSDTEVILHFLAKNPSTDIIECLKAACPKLVGAYSLVVLSKDKMIGIRDPMGFRPLVLGKKAAESGAVSWMLASETCAFDLIGAQYEREVEPGEIIWIDNDGVHSDRIAAMPDRKAACIFEHVYFSRPDSVIFGQSVYASRKEFGRQLAKECPADADLVIPVPDSGIAAALGYSLQSGLPFEYGIIRNHYVGRTFIQPQQSIRSFGVKIKLNPQTAILKGKRVVVIDDSLVRGTTSKKIIELIRQAGAKEVHMRIACPPTTGPCYYGVDTPHKDQLIASQKGIAEICEFIEADSLGYLSNEGMFKAVGSSKGEKKYCAACFDGDYPTPLYDGGQNKSCS
jgi:amidophosphoribosyltransferase